MQIEIYKKKWLFRALLIISGTFCTFSNAQDKTTQSLTLSTIRTAAEEAAIGYALNFAEQINNNERFKSSFSPGDESASFTQFTPSIDLKSGESDSFNFLLVNIKGTYAKAKVRSICYDSNSERTSCNTPEATDSAYVMESNKFHAVPFGIGLETDKNFENLNVLAEVGYVPFNLDSRFKLGLNNKVGIFFQAGYKVSVDDGNITDIGGAEDQSSEDADDSIARLKSSLSWSFPVNIEELGKFYIEPDVNVWWDLANSEIYHKAEIAFRIELSNSMSFDFKYEDGSGAPNFNEGDQFSTNITIQF